MGIYIPSFMGYYIAQKSLIANQAGLNVVNHNISNAGTPGFSRQRVNLVTDFPYQGLDKSVSQPAGQMGQGVKVDSISRIHNDFLDVQYRAQNSISGYSDELQSNLRRVEGVVAEPAGNGVSTVLTNFFEASRAMANDANNTATRVNYMQAAKNVADTFQQTQDQLATLRSQLVGDGANQASVDSSLTGVSVTEINSMLNQIADLNDQISKVTMSNAQPNDLLDKRDLLLDQLSEKLNISVVNKANNQLDVYLGNNRLVYSNTVQNTLTALVNDGVTDAAYPNPADVPALITLSSAPTTAVNADITGGNLGGYLKMGGNDSDITTVRGMMEKLDNVFQELANGVNALQAAGRDQNGNIPAAGDDTVFDVGGGPLTFTYDVNANLLANSDRIAAAADDPSANNPNLVPGFAGPGDGRNALAMANFETQTVAALGNTTLSDYYNASLSTLGVHAQTQSANALNLKNMLSQIDQQRQSFQGVNMEEEMINLLKYQRAFEASARVMTTVDQVMNTLINKMI